MRYKVFLASILPIVSCALFAQSATDILKRSYEKCQAVQSGHYEMDYYIKFMTGKDTMKNSFDCYFRKSKDDSLYSSVFHYKKFIKNEFTGEVLYSGNDFITTNARDSTAIIMSKTMWADDIKSFSHNYTFYSPLTSLKSSPLPHDSDYLDNKHNFKFIGEEYVNNTLCYRIQENKTLGNDANDPIQLLRNELHFWITKKDLIPVQYSQSYDFVMNKDTMYQYEKFVLNKYDINSSIPENIFTLGSIPSYYKMKDYSPYQKPDPLPLDTIAPPWELGSLTGEKVSLQNLKGKLVLIDFFYKSCYPCMLALPGLQSLHEKYKNKGLKIIGIDPYDKEEDDISSFLKKRGVTYTVLLEGGETAKNYRVSGYPTLFLIDRNGKIVFIQEGYGDETDKKLEEIILKYL